MAKKYFDDETSDGYVLGMRLASLDASKTAAVADTTFFTTTSAGLYLICGVIVATTVGTGSGNTIQLVIKAKDESGTSVSTSGAAATGLTLGTPSLVDTVMYLNAGTVVTWNETDGGTQTTHAVYSVHLSMIQLT